MKEFLLIFRRDPAIGAQMSPEQFQILAKKWQDWMGSLAAQNKLASAGQRLNPEGRVVKPDNLVINGPYVELKEAVQGFMLVRAENIEEASELAKGCPVLQSNGTVEVRSIMEIVTPK